MGYNYLRLNEKEGNSLNEIRTCLHVLETKKMKGYDILLN